MPLALYAARDVSKAPPSASCRKIIGAGLLEARRAPFRDVFGSSVYAYGKRHLVKSVYCAKLNIAATASAGLASECQSHFGGCRGWQ